MASPTRPPTLAVTMLARSRHALVVVLIIVVIILIPLLGVVVAAVILIRVVSVRIIVATGLVRNENP